MMRIWIAAFQVTIVECGELKQETDGSAEAVENL